MFHQVWINRIEDLEDEKQRHGPTLFSYEWRLDRGRLHSKILRSGSLEEGPPAGCAKPSPSKDIHRHVNLQMCRCKLSPGSHPGPNDRNSTCNRRVPYGPSNNY
jgi:hypothetical protein